MNTYRIKSLAASSAKFGPCMVCSKTVADVHIQSYPQRGMGQLFGHEECLVGVRGKGYAGRAAKISAAHYASHHGVVES
jgi:hypothetical protein